MKTRLLMAAALLTVAPAAALADSRTYTAIYSPELDIATRSCEIINTGVQGGLVDLPDGGNLNAQTRSANTSIMRTIGADSGTAQSKAGIRFNLVGANIVKLEEASMSDGDGDNAKADGTIVLRIPRAKADIRRSAYDDLGQEFNFRSPENDSVVAKVEFSRGEQKRISRDSGSIVVGRKTNFNQRSTGEVLSNLLAERGSGDRSGTLEFTLKDIGKINETVVMQATITCEPVPVARDGENSLRPIF